MQSDFEFQVRWISWLLSNGTNSEGIEALQYQQYSFNQGLSNEIITTQCGTNGAWISHVPTCKARIQRSDHG